MKKPLLNNPAPHSPRLSTKPAELQLNRSEREVFMQSFLKKIISSAKNESETLDSFNPISADKKDINTILNDFDAINGMMTIVAGQAFAVFQVAQNENNIKGHLAEFGAFKGRSAFIIDCFKRQNEIFYIFDINVTNELKSLFHGREDIQIIQSDSRLAASGSFIPKKHFRNFRLVHVDGNHTFENVQNDLVCAQKILGQRGLCILDDFENPHYPQVQAALYHYNYSSKGPLVPFLIGANKGFLCLKNDFEYWMNFTMDRFRLEMGKVGVDVLLSKTDKNPLFDVVYF